MSNKKPAGEGGQSVYRTITIYSHGIVEVKKTKSKRGKALLARRLNTAAPNDGKRKVESMKLIIDAGNHGKTVECQTTQALLEEIKQEVCQETTSVKVFIDNRCKRGEEAGREV